MEGLKVIALFWLASRGAAETSSSGCSYTKYAYKRNAVDLYQLAYTNPVGILDNCLSACDLLPACTVAYYSGYHPSIPFCWLFGHPDPVQYMVNGISTNGYDAYVRDQPTCAPVDASQGLYRTKQFSQSTFGFVIMTCSNCSTCGAVPAHQLHQHQLGQYQQRPVKDPVYWACAHCGPLGTTLPDFLSHTLLTGHDWPMKDAEWRNRKVDRPDTAQTIQPQFPNEKSQKRPKTAKSKILQSQSSDDILLDETTEPCLYASSAEQSNYYSNEIPKNEPGELAVNELRIEPEVNSSPNSSTKPTRKLTCSKCALTISYSRSSHPLDHVRSCLNIKPFSCSHCRYRSSYRSRISSHIRKACPEADILVDRDASADETQHGLQICFPKLRPESD